CARREFGSDGFAYW
nr:immunoglobulin heavy chain junction region [Mus musculus]MBK4197626.1 immunoglobulin heavy chain junction region [Mus musculus]